MVDKSTNMGYVLVEPLCFSMVFIDRLKAP